MARIVGLLFLLAVAAAGRDFDFRRDSFSFANETVFQYGVEQGELHISKRKTPPRYAHRCFVMCRAVLQFHQFAHFAPAKRRVSRREYAALIRRISRIAPWSKRPREPIVVPGFRDLHHFSADMPSVLQENLGAWFPSYVRVGNYRMGFGHPRSGQAAAARWLVESMQAGRPRALYLSRFPHLNHCVIAYRMDTSKPVSRKGKSAKVRFWLYDPNYPGERTWLDYDPARRSFDFQPRWYFPGGQVNVMRVYLSPFH